MAALLMEYADNPAVVVLGLPRGGVPVAYEVARALRARLDVLVVRKIGLPSQPELAMGAVASGGVRVLNNEVVDMLQVPQVVIDSVAAHELREVERRQRAYRGEAPFPDLNGRIVIIVDDGLATGSTMRAAVRALRQLRAAKIVVAAPVAALETVRSLQAEADEVVCVSAPQFFQAVSLWYEEFSQTSDEEVRSLLESAASHTASSR